MIGDPKVPSDYYLGLSIAEIVGSGRVFIS
jgi:hypothetical protein